MKNPIKRGLGAFLVCFSRQTNTAKVTAIDCRSVECERKRTVAAYLIVSNPARQRVRCGLRDGYDIVLLTNSCNHFDVPIAKACCAKSGHHWPTRPGVTLEFVPNDDR